MADLFEHIGGGMYVPVALLEEFMKHLDALKERFNAKKLSRKQYDYLYSKLVDLLMQASAICDEYYLEIHGEVLNEKRP